MFGRVSVAQAADRVIVALALLLWSPTAAASDFTGLLTFMTALYGGVIALVMIPVLIVTHFEPTVRLRWLLRVASFLVACFLTYAWTRIPAIIEDEEWFALKIVFVPGIVCAFVTFLPRAFRGRFNPPADIM